MPLSDNLISYWSLDEASGNAIDAHGANDLTEASGTIGSAAGKVGNARDFEEGDTEYLTLADNSDLSTGDINFSFCAWVNLEDTSSRKTIVSKDEALARDYGLGYNPGAGGWRFSAVEFNDNVTVTHSPSTGTWYFICAGHSSTANELWISVDGGTPATGGTGGANVDSSAAFRIGASGFSGFEDYFDGLIDEVGFWKRDIRADVAELYNSGTGRDYAYISGAGGTAAITGTATASINEADIVAGGKTIIITLTGDTFIA